VLLCAENGSRQWSDKNGKTGFRRRLPLFACPWGIGMADGILSFEVGNYVTDFKAKQERDAISTFIFHFQVGLKKQLIKY
jgi:hypothetical protein